MYTIDTIEDLIGVLDENPEWVDALRARLLTPELLELPEKFTEFVAKVDAFIVKVDAFIVKVDAFIAKMDAFIVKVDAFIEATNKHLEAMDKRFEAMDKRFEAMDKRFEAMDKRMDRFENSLGVLKGGHARTAAIQNAAVIAYDLGFELVGILSQQKIISLVESQNPADIPKNERRSFYSADLIMEAAGRDGETCYLAVEISFTANGRDTRRAIRNAAFLTRFTGERAYPVVAGMYRDNRIQSTIESGEVFWFQLDAEDLEVE